MGDKQLGMIIEVYPDGTLVIQHDKMKVGKNYRFRWLNMNCVAVRTTQDKVVISEIVKD